MRPVPVSFALTRCNTGRSYGLEQVWCQVRERGFQISLMTLKVPAILEGAAEVYNIEGLEFIGCGFNMSS